MRNKMILAAGAVAALALCVFSTPVPAQAPPTASGAAWPPADLAEKLKADPAGDLDKTIRDVIAEYEGRIAGLNPGSALVKAYTPRLQRKLAVLYREYNQDKKRYPRDCYLPGECLTDIKSEMTWWLDNLGKAQDPGAVAKGRWQRKVVWIERMNIMGHYDLIASSRYDPGRSSPLILSYQDDPDMNQVRRTPYFLVRCIQSGYPTGLTNVENKTRSILKDVAADFNLDPFRIYATGFSYGGHTDLVVAWRYPHWFAAIAPVCNDLRDELTPLVKHLANTPTLLLHGTGDSFLATGRKVHEYMKEGGCPVTFQTYAGGHDPRGQDGAGPFAKVAMLTDFFDQYVTDPYPKTVTHVAEHPRYSRAFWADCKLVQDAGSQKGVFQVRVKDGNRIELDAGEDVAELDLYLSEKLVDMAKPVTVVSGEKTLYEGKPAEKLTVKLRDSPEYNRAGGNDCLWQDLVAIRKAAGFTGPIGQKTPKWALPAASAPGSSPATTKAR